MALVHLVDEVITEEHVAVIGLSNWGHGLGVELDLAWPLLQWIGIGDLDLTERPWLLLIVELPLLHLLILLP